MKTLVLLSCLLLVMGASANGGFWHGVGQFFRGFFYGQALSPEYMNACKDALIVPRYESLKEQITDFDYKSFWGIYDGSFEIYRTAIQLKEESLFCYTEPYRLHVVINNIWIFTQVPSEQWLPYLLMNIANNQNAVKAAIGDFFNSIIHFQDCLTLGKNFGRLLRIAEQQAMIFAFVDVNPSSLELTPQEYLAFEDQPLSEIPDHFGDLGLKVLEKNLIKYAFGLDEMPVESFPHDTKFNFWKFMGGFLYGHHISPAYIKDCYANEGKTVALKLKDTFTQWKELPLNFFVYNNQVLKAIALTKQVKQTYWTCTMSGVPQIMEFVDNVYNFNKISSPWWFWVVFNAAQNQAAIQSAITLFVNAVKFKAPPHYMGLKAGEAFRTVMEAFIILPTPLD